MKIHWKDFQFEFRKKIKKIETVACEVPTNEKWTF